MSTTAKPTDETTRPEGCNCVLDAEDRAGDPLPCTRCWLSGFRAPNPDADPLLEADR